MLDLRFIVENPGLLKQGATKKRVKVDIDKIVKLYEQRKSLLLQAEDLRAEQNRQSKTTPSESEIKARKKLKAKLKTLEEKITALEPKLNELALQIPNPPEDSVPNGTDESDNEIVTTYGKKPEFDFEPKDHIYIGKDLNLIDIDRGSKTSGTRFYYLKNEAVLLEFALIQHVIHKLVSKGFTPVIPPVLVKEEAMYATGFFPADRNEIYQVNPKTDDQPNNDDLYLIGTSEVPLNMLHADEILEETSLPLRYCGFSTCFRREAGSYGKDTAGIIRVHQFDKVEMFSFCHPDKSREEHELLRSIEEEIMQELGFHYQVVNICSGDLGAPAAKKYDIEVWIPTQKKFRELTSCSNCTDFQSRRSKIRYKARDKAHGKVHPHTLNGTAIAIARTLVAILENYQDKDGSVKIPEILRPFMGGRARIEPKDRTTVVSQSCEPKL